MAERDESRKRRRFRAKRPRACAPHASTQQKILATQRGRGSRSTISRAPRLASRVALVHAHRVVNDLLHARLLSLSDAKRPRRCRWTSSVAQTERGQLARQSPNVALADTLQAEPRRSDNTSWSFESAGGSRRTRANTSRQVSVRKIVRLVLIALEHGERILCETREGTRSYRGVRFSFEIGLDRIHERHGKASLG
jgi:hypothetical protein